MKILLLNILIILFLFGFSSQALSGSKHRLNDATIKKIDNYLSKSVENGYSGAILVSENGMKQLNKGYGMANKENRVHNSPKTIFDIGSNTKQFTATAILLLVQQGKLSLSDPITKFIRDVPDDKKLITIHHLLNHTAGLIESIGGDFEHLPKDDFFNKVLAGKLKYPIGSQYAYSNIGYSLLALIIESISSQDYESFLQQNLFKPSGMYSTGYLLPEWDETFIANGYARGIINQGSVIQRYRKDNKVSWHLKGNGGINSSQEDMFLWVQALKNNTILTAKSFELLTTAHTDFVKKSTSYAYGWGVNYSAENTKRLTHNGSNGLFAHSIIWFPNEDLIILFSTNAASPETEKMARTVKNILFKKDYQAMPIKKNPFLVIFDFIKDNDYQQSDKLSSLVKNKYSEAFVDPGILNRIGYMLLGKQQIQWAVEIFKINVELFENNSNSWDSLGDAYLANKQKDQAIASFQKAIELGSKNTQEKLFKLTH